MSQPMPPKLPQTISDQQIAMAGQDIVPGFKQSNGNPLQCAMKAVDLNKPVSHSLLSSDATDAKEAVRKGREYEAAGCATPADGMDAFTKANLEQSGFDSKVINKALAEPPKPK